MKKSQSLQHLTPLFFAIILLEGYIVLSAELLAIRLSLPFVDSGTDTISIIIAAVLLPLACGYYAGGYIKAPAVRVYCATLPFQACF